MSDLSTHSYVLKTYYLPPMQKLFNTQTILWDRLERNTKFNVEGKNFTIPIHYARHAQAGSGRAGTGAVLPRKDHQKFDNAIVPSAYIYTTIEVEGPVIRATKSDKGSFVRVIRSEVEGATESTRRSLNRQANGDGRDALGFYKTGASAGVGTMDDGRGHPLVYFQQGNPTVVDLIDGADNSTKLDDSVTVTVTDENALDFDFAYASGTIDAAATAASDYWVLEDTLGFQMTGLRAIINNVDPPLLPGGLHGLPVASKPWWKSQIVGDNADPQDLRFALLNRVISKTAQNTPSGKEDIKFILTSYAGENTYYELAANERMAVNTMVLDGGFEGVEFSGIPIVVDPEHWVGYYSFIVPDALRICQMADIDWMEDGGDVLRVKPGYDAYEGALFGYMNLATTKRNSLGELRGINMTV